MSDGLLGVSLRKRRSKLVYVIGFGVFPDVPSADGFSGILGRVHVGLAVFIQSSKRFLATHRKVAKPKLVPMIPFF